MRIALLVAASALALTAAPALAQEATTPADPTGASAPAAGEFTDAEIEGFAAAMATGAFLYELWLQRSRSVEAPPSERAPVLLKTAGEEELVKTLRDFVARHEARQTEQNRLLRDLTAAVAEEREFLKPGDKVGWLGIGSGLNCMMLGVDW